MKNKAVSFLLAIVLLLVLTSCGGGGEKPVEVPEEPEDEINLYGYEFLFGVTSHLGNTPELFPPEGFSSVGDKVLKRYSDVSAEYNCDVSVFEMGIGYGNINQKLSTSLVSGTKFADLVETYPSNFGGDFSMLIDFTAFDDFDLYSGKWGSRDMINGMSASSSVYFLYPGYWSLPYPWYMGALFFVPQHLEEAGLTSPFEYYENGTWNWDTFEELSTLYTRNDGDKEYTGFVVTPQYQFVTAAILSNGLTPVGCDENGSYYSNVGDPRFAQAIEWMRDLIKDTGCGEYTSDSWMLANRGIMSGRYAFHCDASILGLYEGEAHYASELTIPWGTIEFPTGPSGEKGQSTTVFAGKYLAMVDFEDKEFLTNDLLITDKIFEYLDGEDSDSVSERIFMNFFHEENSFEHFMHGFETASPSYVLHLPKTDAAITKVFNSVIMSCKAASESIGSILPNIEAEIAEVNSEKD